MRGLFICYMSLFKNLKKKNVFRLDKIGFINKKITWTKSSIILLLVLNKIMSKKGLQSAHEPSFVNAFIFTISLHIKLIRTEILCAIVFFFYLTTYGVFNWNYYSSFAVNKFNLLFILYIKSKLARYYITNYCLFSTSCTIKISTLC